VTPFLFVCFCFSCVFFRVLAGRCRWCAARGATAAATSHTLLLTTGRWYAAPSLALSPRRRCQLRVLLLACGSTVALQAGSRRPRPVGAKLRLRPQHGEQRRVVTSQRSFFVYCMHTTCAL
jgi:hypothetical protein